MNEVLLASYFSRTVPGDKLILVGDVLMGPSEKWMPVLSRFPSGIEIELYCGNHDEEKKLAVMRQSGKFSKFIPMHEAPIVEIDGRRVWLNHIPYQDGPDKRGYLRPPAPGEYDVALCGHVHDKFVVNSKNCINVGVDVMGFVPLTLDEILAKAQNAPMFDSVLE
jgi:calcineurin-like phosphoesterase family protein